jgi:hypothetical protein
MAALRRAVRDQQLTVAAVVGRSEVGRRAVSEVLSGLSAGGESLYFTDLDDALKATNPDAVLIATRTALDEVTPLVLTALEAGSTVLCTSEELAFPAPEDPLTIQLRAASVRAGKAVVAVGVNPGFVFDSLPIWLSTAYGPIHAVTVRRVVDAGVFGERVRAGLGLGVTAEEFMEGLSAGRIRGHVGFPESARIVARSLGRQITRGDEEFSTVVRESADPDLGFPIGLGRVVGITQHARYWIQEQPDPWLTFELRIHVNPQAVGWELRDEVVIDDGEQTVWSSRPSMGAISTTSAQLVNLVRPALTAGAGLMTPVDLSIARSGGGV